MGLARLRTITLTIALATLTSNLLSSLLFAQLPDDPYHLAANFGRYLHFANILSVFGFIGALRQHPLSISLFANYLLLDTLLSSLPRLLLLSLLSPLSSTFCSPSSSPTYNTPLFFTAQTPSTLEFVPLEPFDTNDGWTEESCYRVVGLAQLAAMGAVVAATVLQFVGGLAVREYARGLGRREMALEEERGEIVRVVFEDLEDLEVGRGGVKC